MFPSLRPLRYLLAYTLPLSAALGLYLGGGWAWLTVGYAFGLVPLLELLWRPAPSAAALPATAAGPHHPFFDGLLYFNLPLQYGLLLYFLHQTTAHPGPATAQLGAVLSAGICCGALGINVAHELGHRSRGWEQRLSQLLLLSTWYGHFFIEHNRGHHRHVATPLDPATARFGEGFWRFLPRAFGGELSSAWHLEGERLRRNDRPVFSAANQLLQFGIGQFFLAAGVLWGFGPTGLGYWLAASAVGIVLFQAVNYVEHYGLLRRPTAAGPYERVQAHHSWNSEHPLGRILLYELTRHSDHHYQAARPYHTLRAQPTAPQMPTGYPGMMLLALLPPAWRRVMDARVPGAWADDH